MPPLIQFHCTHHCRPCLEHAAADEEENSEGDESGAFTQPGAAGKLSHCRSRWPRRPGSGIASL